MNHPVSEVELAPDESARPSVARQSGNVTGKHLFVDAALVLLWVLACDFLIYQQATYFAWCLLFLIAVALLPGLKFVGQYPRGAGVDAAADVNGPAPRLASSALLALLLGVVSLKLSWCGSLLQICAGIFLTICYAMSLAGAVPFLPEVFMFCAHVVDGALRRVRAMQRGAFGKSSNAPSPLIGASVILPLLAITAFSTLFVLANPNLVTQTVLAVREVGAMFGRYLAGIAPTQVLLWFFSAWFILGVTYPTLLKCLPERQAPVLGGASERAKLYEASRNTLISLILLFVVYLAFEFATLWVHEFPEDFYYAGYAHQGAFWLTAALALATGLLSAIFRGRILADPRLSGLKRLALVWSMLNLLLAIAVYHRLMIYIDFNGMTRMRIIGLLGISTVVVGFGLVVCKLMRDHGFVWLLHRQLWVPVAATILYAVLPIDWLVSYYNASRIRGGAPAASTQIISHTFSAEGMLPLVSLQDQSDPVLRDGVRALAALWAERLPVSSELAQSASADQSASEQLWTSYLGHASPWLAESQSVKHSFRNQSIDEEQVAVSELFRWQGAEARLSEKLRASKEKWAPYAQDPNARRQALNAFFEYAYQWY